MPKTINQIYFYRYRINLLVKKQQFQLPLHPYALFHGLLGELLYTGNGHSGQKFVRCENPGCAYCNLFKPVLPPGHFWLGKYTNPPVAYVISPPNNGKEVYRKGEVLSLQLTLIGNANKHLPALISAFAQVGNIESTGLSQEFLFHSVEGIAPQTQEKENDNRFTLNNCGKQTLTPGSQLQTESPLFLASKGKLVTNNILEHALQQAHLKYSLFAQLYCGARYNTIIPLETDQLNYVQQTEIISWWRNDNKNGKRVKVKAVNGCFTVPDASFSPHSSLLKLLPHFGIGQYSSYGMGKISSV
ncbi:MAG: hypothetical protein ACEPOZ_20090 [Marinifilaceae bacterium]